MASEASRRAALAGFRPARAGGSSTPVRGSTRGVDESARGAPRPLGAVVLPAAKRLRDGGRLLHGVAAALQRDSAHGSYGNGLERVRRSGRAWPCSSTSSSPRAAKASPPT